MLRCQGKLYDGWMPISPAVAKCPECGGTLLMQVTAWETETGIPEEGGVEIECEHETWPEDGSSEPNHRWWQSDWIDVVNKVTAWARRWVRGGEESTMSRFTDGPAAGATLLLRRAPLMLRVVERERKFDALDMPDDRAEPGERLSVYIQRGSPSGCFVDGRDSTTGKRTGGYRLLAVYEYLDPATFPHDPETFRDNAAWANWCRANEPALRQLWASRVPPNLPPSGQGAR